MCSFKKPLVILELFVLFIFCFQSTDSKAFNFSKDSVSQLKSTTFYPFWSVAAGVGLSINSEFIANSENTPSVISGFRLLRHHQVFSFGIGYDAQVLALKSAATNNSGQIYKYGNPLHSFLGLLEMRKNKNWGNVYLGGLVGYATGKTDETNDLSQFGKYTSAKGHIIGGLLGVEKNARKNFSLFVEFEPKLYMLDFVYLKSGVEKTANHNILVFPTLVGLKYVFK